MDQTSTAIDAANRVMAAHIAALNAGDERALAATLHFPHYRLSGGHLKTWNNPDEYLADFHARAGDGFTLFRLIRRHVEKLGASLQRGELTLHPLETDDERTWVVPGSACEVYLDDVPAGVVSILSPVVRSALKIRGRIAFFELNLEPFFSHPEKVRKFVPLPRYPSIQNDLSVIVDMDVSYASVETVIRKVAGPLLADLTVFAIFRGDPIPAGKKSLSFHLHFRSQERTLQDIEIKPLVEKVIESLRLEVDGEIRT